MTSENIELRVQILEAKMEEVEKFLVQHRHKEEFAEMQKAFPHLFRK